MARTGGCGTILPRGGRDEDDEGSLTGFPPGADSEDAETTAGGAPIRRMLPLVVAAPTVLIGLVYLARSAGLISRPAASSIAIVALVAFGVGFTLYLARMADRAEERRREIERANLAA